MTLLDLHAGRALTRQGLTLVPLFNGRAVRVPHYALHSDALRVEERAGSPVVGELVVTNDGARSVLVLEGELLEGGMQSRVAARSVVVPARASVVLEVRCVEESHWAPRGATTRGARRAPLPVRARAQQGQQQVWDEVRRYEARFRPSATASLLEITADAEREADRLVRDLRPLPYQTGVLVGLGGGVTALECFDHPATLARAWQPLLRSLALDALHAPAVPTPGRRVRRFLDRAAAVRLTERAEAGAAVRLRGRSPYVHLTGTAWHGRLVHTVALCARTTAAAA